MPTLPAMPAKNGRKPLPNQALRQHGFLATDGHGGRKLPNYYALIV
jgi:hypothetical protein